MNALRCPASPDRRQSHNSSRARAHPQSVSLARLLSKALCCWTTLDGERPRFYISLIIKNIFHPGERGTTAGANVNSIAFCCPTLPRHIYIGEKLIDGVQKINGVSLFYIIAASQHVSNLLIHKDAPGGILFTIISVRLSPLLTWLDEKVLLQFLKNIQNYGHFR